jgi:signal transduction histidine kinase
MRPELAEVVAAWPLGASLAAAMAARGFRDGRRRDSVNEALHELRRPLQALALAVPRSMTAERSAIEGSVRMAATALERLEREVNGIPVAKRAARGPVYAEPLLESAVERWRARASLAGGSLALHWRAGEAVVEGDHGEIAQALDNLIVNVIEHGGPEIVVGAGVHDGRLRLAVIDSGRRRRPAARRRAVAGLATRLSGRRLHGHGLNVVRRIAAAHAGDFRLAHGKRGTEAVLELPISARSAVA